MNRFYALLVIGCLGFNMQLFGAEERRSVADELRGATRNTSTRCLNASDLLRRLGFASIVTAVGAVGGAGVGFVFQKGVTCVLLPSANAIVDGVCYQLFEDGCSKGTRVIAAVSCIGATAAVLSRTSWAPKALMWLTFPLTFPGILLHLQSRELCDRVHEENILRFKQLEKAHNQEAKREILEKWSSQMGRDFAEFRNFITSQQQGSIRLILLMGGEASDQFVRKFLELCAEQIEDPRDNALERWEIFIANFNEDAERGFECPICFETVPAFISDEVQVLNVVRAPEGEGLSMLRCCGYLSCYNCIQKCESCPSCKNNAFERIDLASIFEEQQRQDDRYVPVSELRQRR